MIIQFNSNITYKGLNLYLCLICFIFFLFPISISGLGINYSYIIFPLIYFFIKKNFYNPSKFIFQFLFLYTIIFVFSTFLTLDLINFFPRKLLSFLIFISIFFFSFIKIGKNEVISFKNAVILISCYLSIKSIFLFFSFGIDSGFMGKELFGSQRVGFLYIMSFFLIFINFKNLNYPLILKTSIIVLMLVGLLLTFNRSSIISFVAVFLVYAFFSFYKESFKDLFISYSFLLIFGALFLFFFINYFGLTFFEFFLVRLSPEYILSASEDYNDSTSIRFQIWESIFRYVLSNPILGSGFLGPWVLSSVPENSSHSQYFDVLFRTGFIGFILWFLLTLKIIIRLYKIDKALFYGFLSIMIFGFFNETFKLSYGAFIYAFCLAYTFQYTNRKKLN